MQPGTSDGSLDQGAPLAKRLLGSLGLQSLHPYTLCLHKPLQDPPTTSRGKQIPSRCGAHPTFPTHRFVEVTSRKTSSYSWHTTMPSIMGMARPCRYSNPSMACAFFENGLPWVPSLMPILMRAHNILRKCAMPTSDTKDRHMYTVEDRKGKKKPHSHSMR